MLCGGQVQQNNANSEEFQQVATFALNELNARSNSMHPLQLVQVLNAATQVVNGVKYILDLEVSHGQNTSKQRVTVVQQHTGGYQLLDHVAIE